MYSDNLIYKIGRIFFSGTKNADFIDIKAGLTITIILFLFHIIFITFLMKFFFFLNRKITISGNDFKKSVFLIKFLIFLSLFVLYSLAVFFTKSHFWFLIFLKIVVSFTFVFVAFIMNEREKRVFGQYIIVLTIAVSFFIFFTLYIIAYIYFPNFNKPL